MKRYRIATFDFDTRVHFLSPPKDHWEDQAKELHERNRQNILNGLREEFGQSGFDQKMQNFTDLGAKPLSIVAYHNDFFDQARRSFVIGSYYPALTAVCALGERILNHLMLELRDDYKGTPEFKEVYRKDTFDNWEPPIRVLSSWGELVPDAAKHFRSLAELRNRHAIHFNPDTQHNARTLALQGLKLMTDIITCQFCSFGPMPWCFGVPGEIYIKKSAESSPFVRKVYLPNCRYVGPFHQIGPQLNITDCFYEEREISDEEFCKLRIEHRPK